VLRFGAPAFLLAGALLALVPVMLHLLARRPPRRAPLPTARLLEPASRTTLRVERRPTDPLLLALRVLFVLLVAAALARPVWTERRHGTVTFVLLDRGQTMAGVWSAAVDSVRAIAAAAADTRIIVFDTAATVVAPDDLGALRAQGPSAAPARYAAALRALSEAGRTTAFDSATASLVTAPRWGAWSDGLAELRAAAWPGRIEVVALRLADPPGEPDPHAGRAAVVAAAGAGGRVAAALGALGYDAYGVDADSGGAGVVGDARAIIVLAPPNAALAAAVADAARTGARIVLDAAGGTGPLRVMRPWQDGGGARTRPTVLRFDDGTLLDGAATREPGAAPADARLLAAWLDGGGAAAARALGDGCAAWIGTRLEDGRLSLSPAFPAALARLLDGCAPPIADRALVDAPLDAGALRVLEGAGASVVAMSAAAEPAGRPLTRLMLATALAAALAEAVRVYARRATRSAARPGGRTP
jgi:hypothetical protein